jgi:hypothetical protein
MLWIVLIMGTVLCLAGCRQATPADVGAQSQKDASARAISMASERAYQANPSVVPPSATGTPMRPAPQH